MTSEELRAMLVDAGLGRVTDVIVREARPSIRIFPHAVENEDALPLGASKFGGSPDLPPGMAWPRYNDCPLAFIAQINLAEVVAYDVECLLPPSGMIYFFLAYEQYIEMREWPPPSDISRVISFCGDMASLHRTPMPPPLPVQHGCGPYRPRSLERFS